MIKLVSDNTAAYAQQVLACVTPADAAAFMAEFSRHNPAPGLPTMSITLDLSWMRGERHDSVFIVLVWSPLLAVEDTLKKLILTANAVLKNCGITTADKRIGEIIKANEWDQPVIVKAASDMSTAALESGAQAEEIIDTSHDGIFA